MLIVQGQQSGNVQPLRAMTYAIMAARAGQGNLANHIRGNFQQRLHFRAVKRLVFLERADVRLHLRHIRHARKRHRYAGNALQKAERPGRDFLLRAQRLQPRLVCGRKARQTAATQGLHHPHRQVMLAQKLHLGLRVLEAPIQIVELNLAEFHFLAVCVQEALHHIIAAVR